eukprot:CAMPEP_0170189334 /NCGR_PEP_ID=MMETSP0040_2-20121228/46597_1 /TAXON_ID=641309 /ORGANISM="Lotharella oceanica, Strain CCMP622" /LENGTH=62 /DNA_ID=CAMNT_0010436887 /DNA_START=104 /DNA_END=292 /DNA_ORIENTATION=+
MRLDGFPQEIRLNPLTSEANSLPSLAQRRLETPKRMRRSLESPQAAAHPRRSEALGEVDGIV